MDTNDKVNRLIQNPFLIIDEIPSLYTWAKEKTDIQKYIKLDDETSAKFFNLIQILPEILSGKTNGDAYRLEFPEGVAGVLASQNDGYLAMLKDPKTGQIVSQGTLYPIETSSILNSLFSTLSIITNQYYLHQISTQLNIIKSQLNHVLDFLYDDKACKLYAETMAVMGIYRNYSSIMSCTEQRIASIQTIQHAKIFAEQNIQFYFRDMNNLVDKNGPVEKLRDDLHNYTQSINLYGICATTEIVLAQNYDESYLTHIEKDLRAHVTQHNQSVAKLQGKLEKSLSPAPGLPIFQQRQDPKAKELVDEISAFLGDKSPVKGFEDIIRQIRSSLTSKTEYIIEKNGSVYQRKA